MHGQTFLMHAVPVKEADFTANTKISNSIELRYFQCDANLHQIEGIISGSFKKLLYKIL